MPFDTPSSRFQLLTFTVPGLPDLPLAVSLPEVLENTDFTAFTPIPFTPPAVLGLSEWRGSVVTVFDLARLLCGESTTSSIGQWRSLVVQVILNLQLDRIAWPILPGARLHLAPVQPPHADPPRFLNPALIRASFVMDNHSFLLLNLDNLEACLRACTERS